MKKSIYGLVVVFFLSLLGFLAAYAGERPSAPYSGSKEFERLKQLVGTWEGTSNMAKEGQKIRVEYRLSSGGSALVETLFPGTADEMISVYHDMKGQLTMTHYCSLRNQPRMEVQKTDARTIYFAFAGGSNVDPLKDAHMHALALSFVDQNHLIHKWTYFEDGREKGTTVFELTRVR